MKNATILIYHKRAERFAEYLRKEADCTIRTAVTPDEAAAQLAGTDIILCWQFPAELLSAPEAKNVRWIQSTGAGIDNLVNGADVPESITITRIVDQFGKLISEYVLGYMLFHNKGIERLLTNQQSRIWGDHDVDTLEGKVIGVAGLGSIGAEVVSRARAFHMVVHGLSTTKGKAGLVDRHYTADEWTAFVRELDYLVLTLPLTPETRHVVTLDVLQALKDNACLINVGRGPLIVEEALVSHLQSHPQQTAVLDVFDKEPLPNDHPFWSLPNVIVTPHLSGPSVAANVSRYFLNNLERFRRGEPLQGVVDRQRGY
ncbi:D-2-hydroxyacid dehydrogenase [Paenibacillus sp. NPDC058071]|uniref:D-2-hydroxyacid dehydrogenase n=1 Tax=Paenibacillus sp. NPDC058071 TaxID=3346326 RepID=UPI0036DE9738